MLPPLSKLIAATIRAPSVLRERHNYPHHAVVGFCPKTQFVELAQKQRRIPDMPDVRQEPAMAH
jgi:hypothetical protein